VTNHPTVATAVKTSHTHSQNAERLRALVEGVGLAGSFGLVFTEFETQVARVYSDRTTKVLKTKCDLFQREIRFISRNTLFTSLSRSGFSRGP
jgi:hypothetical protein